MGVKCITVNEIPGGGREGGEDRMSLLSVQRGVEEKGFANKGLSRYHRQNNNPPTQRCSSPNP